MADHAVTIGITGNIGSGKSTVARVFEGFGAEIIEGDALGREVVEKSPDFRKWLRHRFGDDLFSGDALDRAALGRIVFRDEQARDELNRAIWPEIRASLEEKLKHIHNRGLRAVVDAAMIYEWGDEERYDLIVVVIADPEEAAGRAAERMGLARAEMLDRYRIQIPAEEKAHRADVVIRNEGTLEQLESQAERVWHKQVATWRRAVE